MAILKYNNVGIRAISACVPSNVYHNRDLISLMSQEDVDKLIKAIGIEEKHIADENVTSSDLCYIAAEKLLEDNNIDRSSIDMILFLSLTHDYVSPSTASVLHRRLGLSNNCACLDLSLACSGFVYALATAYAFVSTPNVDRVLVCVGETMSKLTNPKDKVNFPLYGDAGTVCIVEKGAWGESTFLLSSDKDEEQAIIVPHRGFRNPLTVDSLVDKEYEEGNIRRLTDITMDGMETFNHAVFAFPKQVKALMKEVNITNDDIDFFIPHQANKMMIDFIVSRLKIDTAKVPFCIGKYGNTSCASVPLTIVSELADKLQGEKKLFLASIGAGWSYGSAYLRVNNLNVSPIVEY